ncbi:MAG: tRNA pseudouridine(55) synthase TruB [Clostridiaceae bacterium]
MQGIINLYKPKGISSFKAVAQVRKLTGIKKVGHTGTLDPMASGILLICIGSGTKFSNYIMSGEKTYTAVLKLGITTDTYDEEGTVLEEKDVYVSEAEAEGAVLSFVGVQNQLPPMYSAIKKDGRKLYELARQGIEVDRDERQIEIFSLKILNINLPYIKFVVHCSKGTYIRSLCKDIGDKLGCGGIMSDLERTENGLFKKEDSVNLKDLNNDNINDYIKPIDSALLNYPRLDFSSNYKKILLNGVSINDKILIENLTLSQVYRVYIEGSFIGLGRCEISYFKMIRLLV